MHRRCRTAESSAEIVWTILCPGASKIERLSICGAPEKEKEKVKEKEKEEEENENEKKKSENEEKKREIKGGKNDYDE